jgi:hypothetical protein
MRGKRLTNPSNRFMSVSYSCRKYSRTARLPALVLAERLAMTYATSVKIASGRAKKEEGRCSSSSRVSSDDLRRSSRWIRERERET